MRRAEPAAAEAGEEVVAAGADGDQVFVVGIVLLAEDVVRGDPVFGFGGADLADPSKEAQGLPAAAAEVGLVTARVGRALLPAELLGGIGREEEAGAVGALLQVLGLGAQVTPPTPSR